MSQDLAQAIQTALSSVPPPLAQTVQGNMIVSFVDLMTTTHSLTRKQSVSLQNNLDMLFLGFIILPELRDRLFLELKIPESKLDDMLDDFSNLLLTDEILSSLKSISGFIKTNESDLQGLVNEINKTEATINTLSLSKRNPEPTYTSTQAAILQEGRNNPVPPPPTPGGSRWDTG